jgi:hydroxyethylthiazole kinase-like uncharacterized protein yjeF
MKILTAKQFQELDLFTIQNEKVKLHDLIENAAKACFEWIQKNYKQESVFKIFCGTGNNGGDGLALGKLLFDHGYKVHLFLLKDVVKYSPGYMTQLNKLRDLPALSIEELTESSKLPALNKEDVLIDALFGTGLTRPLYGLTKDLVRHLNNSGAKIISIDLPSGLFCDAKSNAQEEIIKASETLSFEAPKLAFMFPENEIFVGKWVILNVGLSQEGGHAIKTKNIFVTKDLIQVFLKARNTFAHKGLYGHALIIAGSLGKMGAAIMASRACLRTGAGLLTVHVPLCGLEIMQISVPEAMVSLDEHETILSRICPLQSYNAIGVGPGLGNHSETQKALKMLIQEAKCPMVLDADALNILSENKTWLSFLPPNSILTPHPKEFERLSGKTNDSFERHEVLINFAIKYKVYVILKGAHTCIACPDGTSYFNSTGNPGMAKGGSGDALTGMLTGLLAQKYTAIEACLLGVYLHGRSGDIAVKKYSMESLLASDTIDSIGLAYQELRQ